MDFIILMSLSYISKAHPYICKTVFPLFFQDVLMSLAKAVANAAAMLVLKAKNVAQVAEDTVLQNRVIAAATQCALSTSQLVACAKVRQAVFMMCQGICLGVSLCMFLVFSGNILW